MPKISAKFDRVNPYGTPNAAWHVSVRLSVTSRTVLSKRSDLEVGRLKARLLVSNYLNLFKLWL